MIVLIKQATVIDPSSPFHHQKVDLLIRDSLIEQIGTQLNVEADQVIEGDQLCVSAGWLDIGAFSGDPGFEHREDLRSLEKSAAAGGFSALAVLPNTHPVIASKSEIVYLLNNSKDLLIDVLPVGAISVGCEGKEITEMLDMSATGAIAFSDGLQPIQHNGLMMRALLYVKAFDGLVIQQPGYISINSEGQMHEGAISTSLGMKGFPEVSEELMVVRDLYLLEYTQSRLHIANVSTKGTVEKIREAKAKGLPVTASVPAINLAFTDEALLSFDAGYKVYPPLRTEEHRQALIEGLYDGTIDLVVSNHRPLELEQKRLEFPYAEFGAIGLETVFSVCRTYLKSDQLSLDELIDRLAVRPRQILGLPPLQINVGQPANLTLFEPDTEWTFDKKAIGSKSSNTPFLGKSFIGKVRAVINKGKAIIHTF
jgi:dihydroorotase